MIIEIDREYMVTAFSNASFKEQAQRRYKGLAFIRRCGGQEIPATPDNIIRELRTGRDVLLFPSKFCYLAPGFVFKLVEQPKLK